VKFPLKLDTRRLVAVSVGAMLTVGCGLLLHELALGRRIAQISYDLLFIKRGNISVTEAVLVYMDEASHRRLEQPLNAAWDRALHAQLINRLTAAGARAIVFDVVFSDPNPDKATKDELLAKAIKESGRVILGADYAWDGPNANKVIPPFDLVRDVAAEIGSVDLAPDADLILRKHAPLGDSPLSSLSWVTATFCKAKTTAFENSENISRWVNYYGPPNSLPWQSYFDAIDPTAVPDSYFRDKVVFVGGHIASLFAADRKDEYGNPYSSWLSEEVKKKTKAFYSAGVEIQATLFLNLLRGDWLKRLPWTAETFIIIVLGFLFGAGLVRFAPAWAAGIALAGLFLSATGFYLLFSKKLIWFPWLIVTAQIALALSWSILFNSIQLYVQKRLLEKTLRLYLPPALVKKFVHNPDKFLKPGAHKQTLTLFFSDIANFTTMSEGMDGDELVLLMNSYFETAIGQCVHKAQGTVAKYLGDSIFAFWNAPDPQMDHAVQACQAALLLRGIANQRFHGRLLPTRIGLHTGIANVGNFGSEERVDYTALGENVNLASRLEGLNKHVGTFCLISGETKKTAGERVITRPLGKFQLKGFEGLVEVHELVGWPEQAEETRDWREAFEEALNNYEQRNLEFAEIGFRRVLEIRPDDGPSQFFLSRIEEMMKQELPDNWVTHTILKEK
jgi:adenylate cyclase